MHKKFYVAAGCLFSVLLLLSAGAQADSIKLKNGSYFEGRVVEEAENGVTMRLKVGEVFFKASEIDELVYADEEENLMIEKRWQPGETAQIELSKEEVDRDLLEQYMHQGKVRYQGRWITEEAYDVIEREKDIKQKRLRFMKDKEKRERHRAIEEEKIELSRELAENKTRQSVSLDDRFTQLRGRSFGESKTKAFADSGEAGSGETLGKTKKYGESVSAASGEKTKQFASVENNYESDE